MESDDDTVERSEEGPKIDQGALDAAVKRFLASGGTITQVPAGVTTLGAIADHEARKKLERIRNFGDKK